MLINRIFTVGLLLVVMLMTEQCTNMPILNPPSTPTPAADYLQTAIAAAQRGDYVAASQAAQQVLRQQPELLLTPTARHALFGKVNLGPSLLDTDNSPQIQRLEIDYRWSGFSRRQANLVLTRSANGDSYSGQLVNDDATSQVDIPTKQVTALSDAIRDMVPTTKRYWLVLHTDDYPYWTIKLTYSNGTEVVADSNSNSFAYVPWNFTSQGQHMIQYSTAFPNALEPIVSGRIPYLGGFGTNLDNIDANSAEWFVEDFNN